MTFEASFLALSNKQFFKINKDWYPQVPGHDHFGNKLAKIKFWKEFNGGEQNFSKHNLSLCCHHRWWKIPKWKVFNKKLDDHEIEICYFIPLKDHLQRILTVSCCDYFFHTPSRNHLEEHMSKHFGVNRQQKAHGNLYLAFSPLLCVMGVPTKVLLDYMHRMLAGEFLRRLNIWLDHQSDNGFLAESKDEVDVALLNVKFPHDFNRKLRPIN